MSGDQEVKFDQLMGDYYKSNKRYRFLLIIWMAAVLLLGAGSLAIQYHQSQNRQKAIIALEKHNDQQLAQQTRYIQCLAQFFATKDRANRVLVDLDKCNYTQDGNVVNGINVTPTSKLSTGNNDSPAATIITSPTIPGSTGTQPVNPITVNPQLLVVPDILQLLTTPICGNLPQLCVVK